MPERSLDVEAATPPFLPTTDSGTFGSEEWEGWMKWDNIAEPSSPKGSDLSPPSLQFNSGSTGSTSPSDFDSLPSINFSPVYSIPDTAKPVAPSKKRKSAAITGGTPTTTRQPRGQKISHNVIEKRYRSNLNDKIAKLRDSIPELRTAAPTVKKRNTKAASRDSDDSEDDGAGLKFNKATVLTKATEYILQLERQNQRLQSEVAQLKQRGGTFDKLQNPPAITTGSAAVPLLGQPARTRRVPQISPGSDKPPQPANADAAVGMIQVPEELRRFREANATTEHYGHSFPSSLPPSEQDVPFPSEPVRGMIPLADDFRRMREEGGSQAHYAPESSYYGSYVSPQDTVFEDVDADETATRWPRSKAMSRVLVGSLVGLMFMESFSENEESSTEEGSGISARGLFSLPAELKTESRGFRAQIRQRIITFANSPAAGPAARILLLSALFFVVVIAVFMYLAPRGTKNVREGPVTPEQVGLLSANAETKDANEEPNSDRVEGPNAAVHPLNRPIEGVQPVTPIRRALEIFVNDYIGLDWLRSHHLDEEAFKRAGTQLDDGISANEWPYIRQLIPQFLQRSS